MTCDWCGLRIKPDEEIVEGKGLYCTEYCAARAIRASRLIEADEEAEFNEGRGVMYWDLLRE